MTALHILEEFKEEFSQMDDKKAEWMLKKIAEETAETQRYINVCDTFISEYAFKKQKAQEDLEKRTEYYRQQLRSYFEQVQKTSTKTQATYKLPGGTLKLKYGTVEFVRDNDILVKWLKESGRSEFIKIKEDANWSELKKEVIVNNGKVVTNDGEIVDGVSVIKKDDKFEIEF